MRKWLAGGVLTLAAIGSVYLATPSEKADAPPPAAAADRFTSASVPPELAVSPERLAPQPVVDVTDIGPLLDPPAVPAAAESPVALVAADDFSPAPPPPAAAAARPPIPPAAD